VSQKRRRKKVRRRKPKDGRITDELVSTFRF
jgi:hypothetical protein